VAVSWKHVETQVEATPEVVVVALVKVVDVIEEALVMLLMREEVMSVEGRLLDGRLVELIVLDDMMMLEGRLMLEDVTIVDVIIMNEDIALLGMTRELEADEAMLKDTSFDTVRVGVKKAIVLLQYVSDLDTQLAEFIALDEMMMLEWTLILDDVTVVDDIIIIEEVALLGVTKELGTGEAMLKETTFEPMGVCVEKVTVLLQPVSDQAVQLVEKLDTSVTVEGALLLKILLVNVLEATFTLEIELVGALLLIAELITKDGTLDVEITAEDAVVDMELHSLQVVYVLVTTCVLSEQEEHAIVTTVVFQIVVE